MSQLWGGWVLPPELGQCSPHPAPLGGSRTPGRCWGGISPSLHSSFPLCCWELSQCSPVPTRGGSQSTAGSAGAHPSPGISWSPWLHPEGLGGDKQGVSERGWGGGAAELSLGKVQGCVCTPDPARAWVGHHLPGTPSCASTSQSHTPYRVRLRPNPDSSMLNKLLQAGERSSTCVNARAPALPLENSTRGHCS